MIKSQDSYLQVGIVSWDLTKAAGWRTCSAFTSTSNATRTGSRKTRDEGQAAFGRRRQTAIEDCYCTLSATNRNSPSALDTSSRTDFLPSFFS